MTDFIPFLVVGLVTGSVYGMAGMGLVLTYRTSGIFNFAHGALGAVAAYTFWELHQRAGVPWALAALICLAVLSPLMGLGLERLARGLAGVRPAMKIVATVGIMIAVHGLAIAAYGTEARDFQPFLPTRPVSVAGVNVGVDQIIVMVIALAAAAGLYAFLRFTRLGVAMRSVVDDPDLLGLAGTSPARVRTIAWMIGSGFAALSGILLAPNIGLFAPLLTLLVVQAFGAAAVGAFSSLPLTYLGGLLVGVAAALSTKYISQLPTLAGVPPSVPFIVLFVVLLVAPRGRLVEAGARVRQVSAARRRPLPRRVRLGGGLAAAGLLAAVPQLVGTRLPVYSNALIFVIVFLSLGLLLKTSGQISLCQAAFAAVGASTFSHLSTSADLPWLPALVLAGLVTIPVGALIAIPAIRLAGLYLALATFGFGILMERLVYGTGLMFGGATAGRVGSRAVARPELGGLDLSGDTGFYYVALIALVAAALLVRGVERSRLGRLLRALGDSPTALATLGTSVNTSRVLVFCISAFLAGIAGALFGAQAGFISGVGFSPFASLTWLTVLAMVGSGGLLPAFGAAFALAVIPSYASQTVSDYLPVAFGVAAVTAALASGGRLRLAARMLAERSAARAARSPVRERAAPIGLPTGAAR